MFRNIGGKLKGLAGFVCGIGILASVVYACTLFAARAIGYGILFLVCGSLLSWIGSWALYAFGQITDDIHVMRIKETGTTGDEDSATDNG